MRKFLTSFAILCLLLMVSACGGAEPEVAPTEAPAPAATEAPEEEPEPTEAPAPTEAPEEAPEPEPEASADGSIAVLLPDSASSARWENDDRRFFEEAFDAAGVEYTIQNAEGDASTQQTQAEQAITNGAKVLLLVNLDSGSGAAIIAQAREAGVFVIDYDRLTIEGPGADFYVSFDNESVGRLQGEGLVKAVEDAGIENPKVAILNGSPTDNNATLFKNGYDSVINPLFESGDWTEVDDQSVPDWDNQQALVIFEQMLTAAGGEIDAAVAANDGIAGSVAAAIANQGLDYIPVTGQDATVGGIQNILAGRQSMTVYKAIKAEAQAAADLAVALLNGDDTSSMATGATNNGTNDVPSVLLVPVSVTKDNIEETVIADGFRTWEEICVGEFAEFCPDADAGASSSAMDGSGSIAVLLPDSASSARWENDDRRFLEAAFEEAGVEYTIQNAEGDASTQQTQAEQAITNGAKVLLLVNLDSGSGAAIIAQAREAGVAVIDYDRLTIQGEGADYYVSFDNESVGRLQGEGLVKAVEEAGIENPNVAVLNGSPTDNNATLFKNGYDSVINPLFESGEWTEVDDQSVPDWDNQQALVIFEQMITASGGEIDAAVAANDGIAGSVYAALANQGLDPIAVTGQDATVGGIQNILAGRQSMTVYKAIKAEAEAAAALAVAILNGDDTSSLVTGAIDNGTNEVPSVLLVPVSVTKDNIEETVIADGFRTWEEICVGDFAEFCPDADAGADAGDSGDSAMVDGSIAVLLPDSASSARWENDDRRFLEAAFEEAGVEYTIVNAEGDASTQQTQAEQAITNGAKVLLLVNLDSGSGAAIIAQAREAGVAVIDYDRLTIQGEGADYYVSFDNESVGRLQGEGLVKAVEEAGIENPNVAVLNGSPTDNNATLFKNGYDSVINPLFESGAWTEVDDQSVPDWDNQQALVIFEQMITASGGEIDAAIAANDGIAGSVYAALANQGLDPIAVTGQDATVGGIQNILAGRQSMTVYKAIKAEAEAAAALAVAILNGDDTSSLVTGAIDNGTNEVPSVLLVPVSVTKDNIEETVIADGFRTWEEICVGDFAEFCPDADAGADAGDSGPVDGSIAVLLPDSASSARWENDDRRFLEAAFEEAGVEYTIVNAEGDASTQQTQAEQAITNGAKVLLLVNLDSGSGAAIIAQAREAGVAVIDYDRLTIQGEGADYYVSFDNESVGRLQGEGLVKAVEEAGIENPNVAVLNGSPTDNNATLFKNGYDSVINPLFESGEWTEVDDQSVPDWDNQQALVIFEQMITASGGEIDAAVAANDGIAGSVYAALANQGLDPIAVTGQDATVGGIQNILAGRQSMTVYKAIKAEAEAAADLAVAILKGESTDDLVTGAIDNGTNEVPSVLLVPVSVTKDNIEETVIADGFRTWEEICVGDFAEFCPDADAGADAGDSGPVDGSIAVLLPDSASSARWENDDRRFLEAAFEEAGVEYTILNAEGDASTQQTQAEQAITNGAKVLLLVNLDSGSGAAIIAQAREAGVAVIDYDRLTIQGDGADFYVSFDNESVGRLQGEGLVKAVEEAGIENPNVAVLNGSPTDNNATLFKNGYDSVINPLFESGAWTEVDDQSVPDWDNQQALVIFEQMITASGGEIDAAVAANDGIAGSVYAALANQGLDPIAVTGQDATVGGIQNILAGRQSMTVYKAIKAEAEAAADLAIAILTGADTSGLVTGAIDNGTNEVPSVLLVPVSVTKDNIEETVIADGFRTWEEICVGDFAEFCP